MCGIVGLISLRKTWEKSSRTIFEEMLLLDVIRGYNSTGVFTVAKGQVDWRKAAVPSWDFFSLKKVPEFMNNIPNASFVCGHNRAATRGKVVNGNAHPFQIKNITLVHNGTLWNHGNLPGKFEVDSEAIANSLATKGLEETTEKLGGAYSLVWHDSKDNTLNFCRNKERPMNFAYSKDLILFGSEPGLLRWVAERNNLALDKVESTEVDKVYSFEEGSGEPVVKTVPTYRFQQQPSSRSHYGWGDWEEEHDACYPGPVADPKRVVDNPKHTESDRKIVPFQKRSEEVFKTLQRVEKAFKKTDLVNFSVQDYVENTQNKFLSIIGEIPHNKYFTIRGNYSGDVDKLASTKMLLRGEVTTTTILKNEDKVLLTVRNIEITDKPDPFFNPKKKEEPVKNIDGVKSSKILQTDKCDKCNHVFKRSSRDFPYITYKMGEPKCLCINCYNSSSTTTKDTIQ
jgi:hypothetical protein